MRIQTASIILLGSLLSISTASFAKGGAPNHSGVSGKSSVFTAIYDTDGDGAVTTAEVTAALLPASNQDPYQCVAGRGGKAGASRKLSNLLV